MISQCTGKSHAQYAAFANLDQLTARCLQSDAVAGKRLPRPIHFGYVY
jgi:hypothetical protein